METQTYNIAELAAAGGVSSRAVRFYVQQGLLEGPEGVGRGSHYSEKHLQRLVQIQRLQRTGHALAAIKEIPLGASEGAPEPGPEVFSRRKEAELLKMVGGLVSELVTRVELRPGVVVEFDATKYQPTVEGLMAMREMAWEVFGKT